MTVTEYTVFAPIPEKLRIAHVSDLHNAPYRELIGLLERLSPDCIVMTGDIAENLSDTFQPGFAFMRKAAALCPCFFTPGNHERYNPSETQQRSNAEGTGVRFLRYEKTEFRGIAIGGIPSGFECHRQGKLLPTPPADESWISEFAASAPFTLLLSHHPEYFIPHIAPHGVSLTLSGHAHGGQIRLFGQGLFAPGQGIFPKYTDGLHVVLPGAGRSVKVKAKDSAKLSASIGDERRSKDGAPGKTERGSNHKAATSPMLIISRGLANNAPFPRIFNDTELVMITLAPQNAE